MPLGQLLALVEDEVAAGVMFEELKEALGAGEAGLWLRPLDMGGRLGAARIAEASDLMVLANALEQRAPALRAHALSTPHAAIPLPCLQPQVRRRGCTQAFFVN